MCVADLEWAICRSTSTHSFEQCLSSRLSSYDICRRLTATLREINKCATKKGQRVANKHGSKLGREGVSAKKPPRVEPSEEALEKQVDHIITREFWVLKRLKAISISALDICISLIIPESEDASLSALWFGLLELACCSSKQSKSAHDRARRKSNCSRNLRRRAALLMYKRTSR